MSVHSVVRTSLSSPREFLPLDIFTSKTGSKCSNYPSFLSKPLSKLKFNGFLPYLFLIRNQLIIIKFWKFGHLYLQTYLEEIKANSSNFPKKMICFRVASNQFLLIYLQLQSQFWSNLFLDISNKKKISVL